MVQVRCPNCDDVIEIVNPREGALLVCPECSVELEIVLTESVVVDFTDDWQ